MPAGVIPPAYPFSHGYPGSSCFHSAETVATLRHGSLLCPMSSSRLARRLSHCRLWGSDNVTMALWTAARSRRSIEANCRMLWITTPTDMPQRLHGYLGDHRVDGRFCRPGVLWLLADWP